MLLLVFHDTTFPELWQDVIFTSFLPTWKLHLSMNARVLTAATEFWYCPIQPDRDYPVGPKFCKKNKMKSHPSVLSKSLCHSLCAALVWLHHSYHDHPCWSSLECIYYLIVSAHLNHLRPHTLLSCETRNSHSTHHLCHHHASGIRFVPSENAGGRQESEVIRGRWGWTAPASHAWMPLISSMHTFLAAVCHT